MISRGSLCTTLFMSLAALLFLSFIVASDKEESRFDFDRFRITRNGPQQQPFPVTIVSSYYAIASGKKHSVQEYRSWLVNFLSSVELPIVFYCAPEMSSFIKGARGDKPITILTDFDSPYSVPSVHQLGGKSWARAQNRIDPEREYHVAEVYAAFLSKPWLLRHSKDVNIYNSKYFYWVDAGAFRDPSIIHTFANLPSRLATIYSTVASDTIILATIKPFEEGSHFVRSVQRNDEMNSEDYIQGGFFGGKPEAIDWFEEEVIQIVKQQSDLSRFSAKEQPVFTHAARLNWKKVYIQNTAYRSSNCGSDIWFSFEFWADSELCEIPAWNGPQYAMSI